MIALLLHILGSLWSIAILVVVGFVAREAIAERRAARKRRADVAHVRELGRRLTR